MHDPIIDNPSFAEIALGGWSPLYLALCALGLGGCIMATQLGRWDTPPILYWLDLIGGVVLGLGFGLYIWGFASESGYSLWATIPFTLTAGLAVGVLGFTSAYLHTV